MIILIIMRTLHIVVPVFRYSIVRVQTQQAGVEAFFSVCWCCSLPSTRTPDPSAEAMTVLPVTAPDEEMFG